MESEININKRFKTYERVRADVNLDAIMHNIRYMKDRLWPDTKIMAVIKTDGYGHGSVPIAHCLEPLNYIYGFAVATPEEAYFLRENGVEKPILVLGYTFPYAYERMAEYGICATVFRREDLDMLASASEAAGRPIKVHIKVDTGMSRIGICPDDQGMKFIRELMDYEERGKLQIEGIFTHFARADEKDKSNAKEQFDIFKEFTSRIESDLELEIPLKHCANSAGILELPETCMDVVRAGIALYGLWPSDEVSCDDLMPALSLRSHIVYVKEIHKGQSVSYGGTFTADHEMRIATIPVGYGDGYPRTLSGGKGYVLINGIKAPVLGRVCMDQFMVDVSDIPEAQNGSRVTLIGEDGDERITVEKLSELSGRFNYELVCDLGKRVPRAFYRNNSLTAVQDMEGIFM